MQTEKEGEMEMKQKLWDRITAGDQPLPLLARSAASILGAKLALSAPDTWPYLAFSRSLYSSVLLLSAMVGVGKRE